MRDKDQEFMKKAVELARSSQSEDSRPHPFVGAVVVRADGTEVGGAHRGQHGDGDHAEYTVLEKLFPSEDLAGSTVYTTLEPCTTRNHPKVPCVERLIDRRVSRVVIGMLDPNLNVLGRGVARLRQVGVTVELFPAELMSQLEDLNREFIRAHPLPTPITVEHLKTLKSHRLDDWYKLINKTYWPQLSAFSVRDLHASC